MTTTRAVPLCRELAAIKGCDPPALPKEILPFRLARQGWMACSGIRRVSKPFGIWTRRICPWRLEMRLSFLACGRCEGLPKVGMIMQATLRAADKQIVGIGGWRKGHAQLHEVREATEPQQLVAKGY